MLTASKTRRYYTDVAPFPTVLEKDQAFFAPAYSSIRREKLRFLIFSDKTYEKEMSILVFDL